ncbi:MAG: flagellar basal body rod protein FlgC [Rhodospirillales bacterium]
MADELLRTLSISGAGMRTQGNRLRVIAENVANANSLATEPGDLPYRRKIITFKNELDRNLGVDTVRVHEIKDDLSAFGQRFDPNHPAADENGYVLTPNVNSLVEMMDMREAQRSYEANLEIVKNAKNMLLSTIDVLRAQ